MEKSVEVSKELDVKVELKDGKLSVIGNYEGKLGGAELKLHVGIEQVIDAIVKSTENNVDDKLGELLKSALKKV